MRLWQLRIAILLLALASWGSAGCTRGFYREQADWDAYRLIEEKKCPTKWPLEGYSIDVDPASRMYDPFDPDCPPMPPDDPASHRYMHCVDCKAGYPCWHKSGNTSRVEGPNWDQTLPRCENGNVLIDEQAAVQLAFLHSPELQNELEDLYLSALDVSFERFRFDSQFFGGAELIYTADGRDRTGTGESSSLLDLSTRNVEVRKLFATGGELVVGLANSLLWQFAGPNTNAANTLLDFSFVQPLLRLGGRDFVLERLTISERALLANVRQMERFRRGFYMQVVTGRDAGAGPSRRGGVFGGSGLEGFTGVGGGGFGQLGGGGFGGGFGGGITGGAGAAQAGGFLGLLQAQQDIRNQQSTIASLDSSVAQLDAFFQAGRIDYFQVELARQALFNAQSRLLNSKLAFAADKDAFKFQLGIAPCDRLELDDSLIEPFQLLDPRLVQLQNELTALQRQLGRIVIEIIELAESEREFPELEQAPVDAAELPAGETKAGEEGPTGADQDNWEQDSTSAGAASRILSSSDARRPDLTPPGIYAASYAQPVDLEIDSDDELDPSMRQLTWSPDLARRLEAMREVVTKAKALCGTSKRDGLDRAESDIEQLEESLPRRKSSLARLRVMLEQRLREQADTCEEDDAPPPDVDAIIPFDVARLENLPDQLLTTAADVDSQLEALGKQLEDFDQMIRDIIQQASGSEASSNDDKSTELRDESIEAPVSPAGSSNDDLSSGDTLTPRQLYQRLSAQILAPLPNALNELSANMLGVILIQVRARTQNATLVPVELDWREAVATACVHRRDWMNARASLVDTWRLIQFNSDALQSDLNFIFNGDISNVGDNPLDLRGSTGRLQVGLEFDAPITRIAERNTFRQALIEYQQARRRYYQTVDGITIGLRNILRGLENNQVNFELRRAAVEVAVAQVELARLTLQEPPRLDDSGGFGATTARDLVTALSALLDVQNDFLSVWINHESLRRSLDFDLGTMQLDGMHLWIDPGPVFHSAWDGESDDDAADSKADSEKESTPEVVPARSADDGSLEEAPDPLDSLPELIPNEGFPNPGPSPVPQRAPQTDPQFELPKLPSAADLSATQRAAPIGAYPDATTAVAPTSAEHLEIFDQITRPTMLPVELPSVVEPLPPAVGQLPQEAQQW